MDRAKIFQILSVILTTVVDVGDEGTPSGVLYSGLVGILSFDEYTFGVSALKQQGQITEEGHVLRPTDKGKLTAAAIERVLKNPPELREALAP